MKNFKIVAIVPAKGTSERLPGKNMKTLNDEPLVVRAVNTLKRIGHIDEVWVDTDDSKISMAAPCHVLHREQALSDNDTDGNRLLLNAAEQVAADVYVQLLCTSPFITPQTIVAAIEAVTKHDYESSFLMRQEHLSLWDISNRPPFGPSWSPRYDLASLKNSQDIALTSWDTTGLYVVTSDALFRERQRTTSKCYPIIVPPIEAIDINTLEDWELAVCVANGQESRPWSS